jgi:putative transposase
MATVSHQGRLIKPWQVQVMEDENRRLKKMFAELSMQNELLKEALGKK